MTDLIQRLSEGVHPVKVGGPHPTARSLEAAIGRRYVHILFTETRGGTELSVALDEAACDLSSVNYESASGAVHLEGTLTLDGIPVRCIVDLDVSSLAGTGQLKPTK